VTGWSQVGSNWIETPLRRLFLEVRNGVWGEDPESDEGGLDVVCVRVADFERARGGVSPQAATVRRISESQFRAHRLRVGDVLLEKSGGGEKSPVGFAVLYDHDLGPAVVSNFVARGRVRAGHDSRFLAYVMRSLYERGAQIPFVKQSTGIQNLDQGGYLARRVPIPPCGTQVRIADFLDRETAHIDALIEKKERLIRLLDEKRAAMITQAVTKGLNPDAPMKDSGVEWIGEIPEHWETAPLGALFEVQLGKMLDGAKATGAHLRPYLRNQDVQWDRVNTESLPEMDFLPRERARFALRAGDLLVCEGGDVGRTAMWKGELAECYYQKAIHRLRPTAESGVPRFLYFVMRHLATAGAFLAGSNPNTIPHLTAVQLRRHRMPVPPPAEARGIAARLNGEGADADRAIASCNRSISLLRERRAALITAAVTGQIDIPKDPS
jgi:type I restriction enzyme, S subunit